MPPPCPLTRNIVGPELERMQQQGGALPLTDFKSALQEAVQGLGLPQPAYVLVDEAGPEHSKTFTVEARLNMKNGKEPEFVGRAQGSTKKTAEQDAARQLADDGARRLLDRDDADLRRLGRRRGRHALLVATGEKHRRAEQQQQRRNNV